ncbi:MAG: M23 family metallopeptidase [Spirochaetota bacterium]
MNRFSSTRTYAALLLLLLLIGSAEAASQALRAVPGEVLTIDYPEPLRAIELLDAEGRSIGRFKSFRTNDYLDGQGSVRVLIPLSSLMEAGEYELQYHSAAGSIEKTRPLKVVPREFRSETIPLDYSLTELRSSDDPEKYEQALTIQEIYARFNADRVMGTLQLDFPLPKKDSGEYRITSYYGDRRIFAYSDESTARSIHTGIDFAADVGTPVLAAGRGRVVLAADRIISGYSVVIEHMPGMYTVYFHLHQLEVETGELVETGQKIGTVGMSGLATGPHLHWEVRVQGVAVDPAMLTQIE